MSQDQDYLRILSVFHYVVAAIAGLFSLLPVIHLTLGIAMATGALSKSDADAAPLVVVGSILAVFAGLLILCGLTFSVCLAVAGWHLGRHRHWTYCLVMACIACVFVPFGTVLGVLTLIVLVRPSAKALFGVAPAAGS